MSAWTVYQYDEAANFQIERSKVCALHLVGATGALTCNLPDCKPSSFVWVVNTGTGTIAVAGILTLAQGEGAMFVYTTALMWLCGQPHAPMMQSPNGNWWVGSISNAGVLTWALLGGTGTIGLGTAVPSEL